MIVTSLASLGDFSASNLEVESLRTSPGWDRPMLGRPSMPMRYFWLVGELVGCNGCMVGWLDGWWVGLLVGLLFGCGFLVCCCCCKRAFCLTVFSPD